ncbi:MAG: LpxD N-terminal domain-containing protein [Caulobacteraceae bacterium]
MPDLRFFEDLGPVSLVELAAVTGAALAHPEDGERRIANVAPLVRGDAASVSFFSDRRYLQNLKTTRSGACFVAPDNAEHVPVGCAVLLHKEPHAAYSAAANRLHRMRLALATDPPIHPTAQIEEGVILAPGVIVGAGARIGRGTSVGSYSVIGPGVAIGRNGVVGSHVTIGFALIGDRCRILSGAVIGEPGFGVTMDKGRATDVPQLGR